MWGTLTWFWLWRNKMYLPCCLPWRCMSKFFVRHVGPLHGNQVSKIILARGCQSKPLTGGKGWLVSLREMKQDCSCHPDGPVIQCHKVQGPALQKDNMVPLCDGVYAQPFPQVLLDRGNQSLCCTFHRWFARLWWQLPTRPVAVRGALVATRLWLWPRCVPELLARLSSLQSWGSQIAALRGQFCHLLSVPSERHWPRALRSKAPSVTHLLAIAVIFVSLDKEGHWLEAGESNPSCQIELLSQWHLESLWFGVCQEENLGYFGLRKCGALQKKAVCWEHFGSILSFLLQSG